MSYVSIYLFLWTNNTNPPDLPDHCNECSAAFDICHAIDCKKRGLIMARRNKICDGVVNLVSKAFTSTHVCDDPKIYTGRSVHGGKEKLKGYPLKDDRKIEGVSSSETSGCRSQTVFTTCVSWILMPLPTSPKTLRSAWKPLIRWSSSSSLTPVPISLGTSIPSLPQWRSFLGSRWRWHLNASLAASQRSGRNPTHVPVGT